MATSRAFVASTLTAVAPVAALPTTAAHFALFNGEPSGGKTYTILTVGFTTTTSAGATMIMQQLVILVPPGRPIISGTAASVPYAMDGSGSSTRATVASAVTLPANAGLWHPVGQSTNSAALTATIGLGVSTVVKGIYSLPPGGIFALATLGSTTGGALQSFITWSEDY